MNAAKLEKSDRLQRVYELLKQGGEYSTMDIVQHAHVCAVNSIISELRQNGVAVQSKVRVVHDPLSKSAKRLWYYSLGKA